jgi:hypothetical protein
MPGHLQLSVNAFITKREVHAEKFRLRMSGRKGLPPGNIFTLNHELETVQGKMAPLKEALLNAETPRDARCTSTKNIIEIQSVERALLKKRDDAVSFFETADSAFAYAGEQATLFRKKAMYEKAGEMDDLYEMVYKDLELFYRWKEEHEENLEDLWDDTWYGDSDDDSDDDSNEDMADSEDEDMADSDDERSDSDISEGELDDLQTVSSKLAKLKGAEVNQAAEILKGRTKSLKLLHLHRQKKASTSNEAIIFDDYTMTPSSIDVYNGTLSSLSLSTATPREKHHETMKGGTKHSAHTVRKPRKDDTAKGGAHSY